MASLKELKQQLRDIRNEMAGLEAGSVAFNNAAARAGALSDQLGDINQQINAFAGGSQFEIFGNVLGDVGSKLANLDFGGAAESATALSDVVKNMNFSDVIGEVENLGSTFLTLGKTIGTTVISAVKSFSSVLLSSPIGIIIAAVGALVVILGVLAIAFENTTSKAKQMEEVNNILQKGLNDLKSSTDNHIAVVKSQIKILEAQVDATNNDVVVINKLKAAQAELNDLTNKSLVIDKVKLDQDIKVTEQKLKEAQANEDLQKKLNSAMQLTGHFGEVDTKVTEDLKKNLHDLKIERDKATTAQIVAHNEQLADLIAFNKKTADEITKQIKENNDKSDKASKDAKEYADKRKKALDELIAYSINASQKQAQAEIDAAQLKADKINEIEKESKDFIAGLKIVEVKTTADLDDEYLDAQEKKEKERQARKQKQRQREYGDKIDDINKDLALGAQSLNAGSALSNALFDLKRSNLKKGSKEELEAARKQFDINKAFSLASATVTGIEATLGAYKAGAILGGPVLGGIYAAIAGVTAVANIIKIQSSTFEAPSSAAASNTSTNVPTSTTTGPQASPSLSLFGNKSTDNNISQGNNNNGNNNNNQTVTVSAVVISQEITDHQTMQKYSNKLGHL